MDDITVHMRVIGQWADEVFPERTTADAIKKLSMEEVPELWRSMKGGNKVDPGEIADVLILALDLCYLEGLDPVSIIDDKMTTNRKRRWIKEHGVMQHED